MTEADQGTKSVTETNTVNSTEETQVVRKPVRAPSQPVEESSVEENEGDRSPIRQERDTPDTDEENTSPESIEHPAQIVREPVGAKPSQVEVNVEGDRSPIRQERDTPETEATEHSTTANPSAPVVRKPVNTQSEDKQ